MRLKCDKPIFLTTLQLIYRLIFIGRLHRDRFAYYVPFIKSSLISKSKHLFIIQYDILHILVSCFVSKPNATFRMAYTHAELHY